MNSNFDVAKFEEEWTVLASEICQAIYVKPEIQELKTNLQKNGFMTLEEKSQFIDICNKTKYELIYAKYGAERSEGYKNFSDSWQQWFQLKGVESEKGRTQRSSVDHILFGSTPDPAQFLLHFEEEILGRMKEKKRE
jgi:hypothetical protein